MLAYHNCALFFICSSQILMKLKFSRLMFEKYPNIKFRENPFIANRVGPCGRADRQTDMAKLIVTFANLRKSLKKTLHIYVFLTAVTNKFSLCSIY
jgi:hypothetical protein